MVSPEALLRLVGAFATMYLVALGHSLFEKSGILNLAIDGVFFLATGVTTALVVPLHYSLTGYGLSPVVSAILAGLIAGLATAVVGAFMAWSLTKFPISHGAVGLSLMFLGYGLGIIAGYEVRLRIGSIRPYTIPDSLEVYLAILVATVVVGFAVHYLLNNTVLGTSMRACGENPHVALALGADVAKIRVIAGLLGFYILGVGASFFVLIWQKYWDIKAYLLAYGWLAFTIALSAGRHPLLLLPFAALFGGLVEFSITLQAMFGLQADLAKMIPFIAALALMAIYGSTRLRRIFEPPTSLGRIFYKEEKTI
jgi:simple sugar transport system permease protein